MKMTKLTLVELTQINVHDSRSHLIQPLVEHQVEILRTMTGACSPLEQVPDMSNRTWLPSKSSGPSLSLLASSPNV